TIDTLTGVITQATAVGFTLVEAKLTAAANGLYEVDVSYTDAAGTAVFCVVGAATSGTPSLTTYGLESFAGRSQDSFYAGWAQLNAGRAAPYVPTTSAAATLAASLLNTIPIPAAEHDAKWRVN